jgi:hypothetical protein
MPLARRFHPPSGLPAAGHVTALVIGPVNGESLAFDAGIMKTDAGSASPVSRASGLAA